MPLHNCVRTVQLTCDLFAINTFLVKHCFDYNRSWTDDNRWARDNKRSCACVALFNRHHSDCRCGCGCDRICDRICGRYTVDLPSKSIQIVSNTLLVFIIVSWKPIFFKTGFSNIVIALGVRKINISGFTPVNCSPSVPKSVHTHRSRGSNVQKVLGAIGPVGAK